VSITIKPKEIDVKARLCYVENDVAYFTTCEPLDRQWGDDWNDAPYEHNAGAPYEWHEQSRVPKYEIFKVVFYGDYRRPCDGVTNSAYCVQDINLGSVAWLAPECYGFTGKTLPRPIPAGTTLEDFAQTVTEDGGTIYWPVDIAAAKFVPRPKERRREPAEAAQR
jgi:hypothetical protein